MKRSDGFPNSDQDAHLQRSAQPPLLTAAELAKMMRISARTLWRLLSSGQLIKPIRIGGNTRWRREEVQMWIDQGCPLPTTGDN